MKYINSNLITLKCVLFLFFGGMGALYPFLPLHMTDKGLSVEETKIISIVAPCIALLGPAIAGPLADKLAGGSGGSPRSKNGKYLRVMIALCFILAILFYWILAFIPTIGPCELTSLDSSVCNRSQNVPKADVGLTIRKYQPTPAMLRCNGNEGEILITKCIPGVPCNPWQDEALATFYVTNCTYTCASQEFNSTTIIPEEETTEPASDYDPQYVEDNVVNEAFIPPEHVDHSKPIPHPHLCYTENDNRTCHVYSSSLKPIKLTVPLKQSENKTNQEGICTYPISGDFHCRMGPQIEETRTIDLSVICNPVIKCVIHNPYNKSKAIVVESPCHVNPSSFWLYLFVRSFGDIFPAAAVGLLGAAIIIATRETSTGRGDVGKQFAAGALGFALFAIIGGAVAQYVYQMIVFTICLIIAAVIILFDSKMPLSPPEWWWHTRCGLLAFPMASIRKYGLETGALAVILLLLGIFWSGIDPFIPWHIKSLSGDTLNIGLTITVGALPAVLFLFHIEKIVDYCGHSNILIAAFTFYIMHYTALTSIERPWLLLLCEALEIFTLHIMWVTVVLYLRHLVPRRFTASGQALPVITHFCLGRLIGTIIGGMAYPRTTYSEIQIYEQFAVAAAVIAIFYFLAYHFYLKPRCPAPVAELEPQPALIQSVNGNGAYTPLKVYHNSKAKKGQFKY